MKIAVVGAGAAGLVAAHRLTQQGHDVSVFESGDRCGGHVRSEQLPSCGVVGQVETGFLVFNESACPRFTALLAELSIATRTQQIQIELRDADARCAVRAGSFGDLLRSAAKRLDASMVRFAPDWVRFIRRARRLLRAPRDAAAKTLGEFIAVAKFSETFANQFLYPLAGAVNPVTREQLKETPLTCLLALVQNHGLMKLTRDLQCRTLAGGSSEYLRALTASFESQIHLNCPIAAVARHDHHVLLKFVDRPKERFEQVVMAVHADDALRLLADPTRQERQVLSTFEYAPQTVYVHRSTGNDAQVGAYWRFELSASGQGGVCVSYSIPEVQDVEAPGSLRLTMAGPGIAAPHNILRTIRFRRPVLSIEAASAQRRFAEINGRRRTYFCGAYWGHGFHEDAIRSAEEVARAAGLQPAVV